MIALLVLVALAAFVVGGIGVALVRAEPRSPVAGAAALVRDADRATADRRGAGYRRRAGARRRARGASMTRARRLLPALALLGACARQVSSAVSHAPDSPGFLLGVWHGFIFPAAWVLSLFMPDVAIYAVPNQGGWYDFGYFVGIVFLGVGARSTRTVYVARRSRG